MGFQIPEPPILLAGGIGGPFVMFTVTPMRNGLTLAAGLPKSGAFEIYGQVFSKGFLRGWTGGVAPAIAACPQFLCLGPAYHLFASFGGVTGGVCMTSLLETAIAYGPETNNAQQAKNVKSPGSFPNPHSPYKPFGPGVGIHIFRNVLATAGLRMFCTPATAAIEKVTGAKNEATTLAGSFAGNVLAACLTAPVHQCYNFTVSTPELQTMSSAEQLEKMKGFLTESYFEAGKLKPTVGRDMFMRSMYVAVAYTMFSTIERACVAFWPKK
mmetsp:Transcript_87363/g.151254  ORF Transcript_87363/g.151254 Transcript_87363/m.151254 type:complete len:269 (+) Transcript_87363:89-895(+)